MEKTNNKKLFLITLLILSGLLGVSLFAQTNKDALKEKLKQLDGKIEKITVKVDGKDVVFEGEEVERISRPIKRLSKAPMIWMEEGGDFSRGQDSRIIKRRLRIADSLDWNEKDGDKKKIEVQIEDGEKKVTVTTMKDGKEETKTYEGEEAEKMLKEEHDTKSFNIKIDGKEDDLKDHMIFMRKHVGGGSGCRKYCCGGHSMGMSPKHMMIKEFNGDDEKNVQVIIKKK